MSWFKYGDIPDTHRKLRKGLWLRVRTLPAPLLKRIKKRMRLLETLRWVVVAELRPDGQVLLEAWSQRIYEFDRYTVVTFLVKEDPDWICEGDLGRGFPKSLLHKPSKPLGQS